MCYILMNSFSNCVVWCSETWLPFPRTIPVFCITHVLYSVKLVSGIRCNFIVCVKRHNRAELTLSAKCKFNWLICIWLLSVTMCYWAANVMWSSCSPILRSMSLCTVHCTATVLSWSNIVVLFPSLLLFNLLPVIFVTAISSSVSFYLYSRTILVVSPPVSSLMLFRG